MPNEDKYQEFFAVFEDENKDACVEMAVSWLEKGELTVVELYTDILMPSLNDNTCRLEDHVCIWKEHLRTSIVRTIIECAYPFIIKERKKFSESKGRVLVVCPSEEYHEIGARMVADFFSLNGYDVSFVGANTPQDEIISATSHTRPKYVVLSVTNHYNLISAKRTIEKIRKVTEGKDWPKIIVRGQAFKSNPGFCEEAGADLLLQTYEDISKLDLAKECRREA